MNEINAVIEPKEQLKLFGYEKYFNFFVQLYENKKLPSSILLSGLKGSGKSTFAYHFINYIYSISEDNKYDLKNYTINKNNISYRHINLNTHSNFYLIKNESTQKEIKIDQSRNLIRFLNKTTYSKNIKIVMIDNVENLNINASNALLKAIEEPPEGTFFFIIHDSSYKILNTLKSRCMQFKISFTSEEKKNIFTDLSNLNNSDVEINNLAIFFNFDSPGNILKYYYTLKDLNIDIFDVNINMVTSLIDKYLNDKKKNYDTLNFISLFIEIFYRNLCLNNPNKSTIYYYNYIKVIQNIDNMKKFNLYDKNMFISIKNFLYNEKK